MDAIIGAPRYLHTVQASRCTGCELCLASCPVDCIQMRPREAASAAPSSEHNRRRFEQHRQRARLRDVQRAALLRERKHVEHDVAAEEPAGTPAAAMTPQRCRRIFEALRAANPEPRSELQYRSPFELLIAVMLSAQATDRSVNLATAELFRIASTSQAMLELGLAGLKRHIRTIGLYNTKARNIVATCKLLVQQHDGQVPHAREALEALPGVGRKTANVVLNVAFGEPTLAVDTHVFRVANRTGLARAATPREVEDELLRVIPREFLPHAHHWLILHGRYVCKARRPECPRCPIARWCGYEHKTPALSLSPGSGHRRRRLFHPALALSEEDARPAARRCSGTARTA